MRKKARTTAAIDAGLKEIADWHTWFLAGHAQRLQDLHLPQAESDAQLAVIVSQAEAIVERMREQYLTNARRPS